MLFRKPFEDRNAKTLEICGHGRVDVLIRSGDVITALQKHSGQRSHGGSGDSDEVNAFDRWELLHMRHRSLRSKIHAFQCNPGNRLQRAAVRFRGSTRNPSTHRRTFRMSSKRNLVITMAFSVSLFAVCAMADGAKSKAKTDAE